MNAKKLPIFDFQGLESRLLFTWASYAQLVNEDDAATHFPSINGSGVTVAVIDTGIDYNVASLGGGFGAGKKVIGGYDFYANDSDPMDEDGHGTSVAGVIAANPYTVGGITYQGVAPSAKLVALRVGTETNIPNANIHKALQWIVTNYATYGISVVNLSLGSSSYTTAYSDPVTAADFKQLHDLGIFVVAASGNSNDQATGPIGQDGIASPAADPNVFAVGAVDSSDVITTWAQRGSELDLLAPGVNIVMPKKGGGTVTEDGTSFASPYVAGTVALLRQAYPSAKPGDIGSILMSSGHDNRDGDVETGNTTGLDFSRLDIDAALTLVAQRNATHSTLSLGTVFDTAIDSQGVLHAAYYDAVHGDVLYATRSVAGLWSNTRIVDSAGTVGAQLSIAVDTTGKVGIGYFDSTNTAIKYASFNGVAWSDTTIDSDQHVGTYPSLAFGIDGNAYLGYYKRSTGDLKLARLDRDTGTWTTEIVDGASADVGANLSLDVGEAAVRNGAFTVYDTTVAMAYSDTTNGDLKYARLDIDSASPTWFISVVADTGGVSDINLNLHEGPLALGLQAQIAYRDYRSGAIRYAYRNTDWFTETVITSFKIKGPVQLYFTSSNDPVISFLNISKRALYTGARDRANSWSYSRVAFTDGPGDITTNERTGDAVLTTLDRAKSNVTSTELV